MPEQQTARLFFALWPDDEVRRQLWVLSRTLGEVSRHSGKPVAVHNLHLTLAFLGAVNHAMRCCVEQAAARVEAPPFEITLDCAGYWGRPRIQWAGCEHTPAALQQLVEALNQQLGSCGYQPERREFAPHVTLRRKSRPLPRSVVVDPITWKATDFCLVQSVSAVQGVEYRVLRRWALGRGGGSQ